LGREEFACDLQRQNEYLLVHKYIQIVDKVC